MIQFKENKHKQALSQEKTKIEKQKHYFVPIYTLVSNQLHFMKFRNMICRHKSFDEDFEKKAF